MKDIVKFFIGFYLAWFFIVVTLVAIRSTEPQNLLICRTKLSRFEYVFPAFRLGCWLGAKP